MNKHKAIAPSEVNDLSLDNDPRDKFNEKDVVESHTSADGEIGDNFVVSETPTPKKDNNYSVYSQNK